MHKGDQVIDLTKKSLQSLPSHQKENTVSMDTVVIKELDKQSIFRIPSSVLHGTRLAECKKSGVIHINGSIEENECLFKYLLKKELDAKKMYVAFTLARFYGLEILPTAMIGKLILSKTRGNRLAMLHDALTSVPLENRKRGNLFVDLLFW